MTHRGTPTHLWHARGLTTGRPWVSSTPSGKNEPCLLKFCSSVRRRPKIKRECPDARDFHCPGERLTPALGLLTTPFTLYRDRRHSSQHEAWSFPAEQRDCIGHFCHALATRCLSPLVCAGRSEDAGRAPGLDLLLADLARFGPSRLALRQRRARGRPRNAWNLAGLRGVCSRRRSGSESPVTTISRSAEPPQSGVHLRH